MNLKDHLSKFQAKADEGIFLGYSHNSVAYRVLNKRTRKVEETFNLTFDDYYVKSNEHRFSNNPILQENHDETESIQIDDTDYDLIFGISDHAVDAEVHAPDNNIPEISKLTDDSPSTPQADETIQDSPLEGEQLDSNTLNDEEHSFEGEKDQLNVEIEGEHGV